MKAQMNLKISVQGENEIIMIREFNASCEAIFEAHTKPELIRRWLLGPDDWEMRVCEVDLKVGGKYRYVWRHSVRKEEMGMGGVFKEISRPKKIVQTEKFDHAWYPGEAYSMLEFSEKNSVTTLKNTIHYASKEARDSVMKSHMASGVEAGYNRLAIILEN
jgi:uncharacterized protein YndB with AHSA1/START domain